MRFNVLLSLLLVSCILPSAHAQDEATKEEDNVTRQTAPLKAIQTPIPAYPEEALRKGVEGKVTLSIVVDQNGNVSQAKVLNGPEELIPATIASVKMWKFEPPAKAPVTKTVAISYGHPKECPGPISDRGEVMGGGRLFDKNGQLAAVVADPDYELPPYPEKERKAGAVGTMILSITLNADGHVKKIRVFKPLSANLDKAAINAVRPWRFRAVGHPESLRDLRLTFVFRAACRSAILSDE